MARGAKKYIDRTIMIWFDSFSPVQWKLAHKKYDIYSRLGHRNQNLYRKMLLTNMSYIQSYAKTHLARCPSM